MERSGGMEKREEEKKKKTPIRVGSRSNEPMARD